MSNPREMTVGEYFAFMAGAHWEHDVLGWPPDIFCMLSALLQRTGGYIRLVSSWPPLHPNASAREPIRSWTKFIQAEGSEWWCSASLIAAGRTKVRPPSNVDRWWRRIQNARNKRIDDLESQLGTDAHKQFWNAVLQLCSAADEACIGIGFTERSVHRRRREKLGLRVPPAGEDILWTAARQLADQESKMRPSTLTKFVRPSVAVVLPKLHTPQSGITLRSISHNLAFLRACEVKAQFYQTLFDVEAKASAALRSPKSLNLVLVPWPTDELVPVGWTADRLN